MTFVSSIRIDSRVLLQIGKGAIQGQVKFVSNLFMIAA